MRFGVICPHHGYINRGTENMTDDINKVLEKRGHSYKLFTVDNEFRRPYFVKTKGIGKFSDTFLEKTMLGGFFRKYVGFNPNIEDITFALNIQIHVDVLSGHFDMLWSNGEFWCANMITKVSERNNVPSLIFFGGGISKMMKVEAKMHPDIFVVLSPVFKEWLDKKVPECNVKCIPSGVDLNLFKKTKELSPRYKYEEPIVCTTSALVKGKRVDLIIDAMKELGKGTLFVTNDGPMRNFIVNKGKQALGDRFHYLGILPFEDLPKLYSMCDVFVLASDNEPWGAVLLEAMACGCNVVAKQDKTRKFMLEDNAVLVPEGGSWKSAIELAWKSKSFNPRKQAEKFSWEKTVDGYLSAIGDVV